MKYEVTIGIPVYNVERYIAKTMDAALSQTFESIEFLVLDDCGTDNSISIIREYQQTHPRGKDIHIVRQPQNMGIGQGRNRIIQSAMGRYLYFLDGDDAIEPNTIELLHQQVEQYDAELVYGSYRRIDDKDGRSTDYAYPLLRLLDGSAYAEYAYSRYDALGAPVWNILMSVDVLRHYHIQFQPVNYWEDFGVTINFPLYFKRAVLLPDVTYHYYCREGSLSRFQKRTHIDKMEIQQTIGVFEQVKREVANVKQRSFLPQWHYKVMMTDFYIVCTVLKNRHVVFPSFSLREIRNIMRSPLSLPEVLQMKSWRLKNLAMYLLGVLPAFLSVSLMWLVGKMKGLI